MQDRNWGYRTLIEGLGEGLNAREERMAQLAKQKQDEEDLSFERELGKQHNVPDYVFEIKDPKQRQFWLKHYLKPKTLGQHVSDIAGKIFGTNHGGSQQSQQMPTIIRGSNNAPLAIQVGGQIVPADQISPETINHLEELEQQQQMQNEPRSWAETLGQFSTGAGVGYLAKRANFVPDIASSAFSASKYLQDLGTSPTDVKNWQYEMMERNPNMKPLNLSPEQEQEAIEKYKSNREPTDLLESLIPSTHNILNKYIPGATKGTPLEPYTTAKGGNDRAREAGNIATLFTRPAAAGMELAKNFLKGTGIALAGDAVDIIGEHVTGSEAFGKGAKLAFYIGAGMYPGSAEKLSKEGYDKFKKDVIDKAAAEGTAMQAKPFQEKMIKFAKEVNSDFPHLSEDAKQLQNYITRVKNASGLKNVTEKEAAELTRQISSLKKVMEKHPNNAILSENLNKLENKLNGVVKDTIDPERMWSSIKDLNKIIMDPKNHSTAPYFQRLKEMQEEALNAFADTVTPEGGRILKESNSLFRTHKQIEEDRDFIKSSTNIKGGPGTLLWLTSGGYKAIIGLAGVKAAQSYMQRMLNNPTILRLTKEFLEASASRNVALTKQIADKLNKEGESVISQLSPEDQKAINHAIAKTSKEKRK